MTPLRYQTHNMDMDMEDEDLGSDLNENHDEKIDSVRRYRTRTGINLQLHGIFKIRVWRSDASRAFHSVE